MPKARVLALYLPQFHPTPENDKFWGKGFTEWTNVAKAKPLFPGHYQPHIPADLGFYDLRLPEVREAQADMAREAGIEGFMYWHYWFGNGKKTLERPFEEVLASGRPNFPFCRAWANHSWTTKTWKKGKGITRDHTIFEMDYSDDNDMIDHFYYCLPAFKDKRYVCIDGKPVFAIYSLWDFNKRKQFIETWQELAHKNGLSGIYFIAMTNGRHDETPDSYLNDGFDAINPTSMWIAEYKLRKNIIIKRGLVLLSKIFRIPIQGYNFEKAIPWLTGEEERRDNIFPTVICGYDRTPRAGKTGQFYYNYNPKTFRKHLKNVISHIAHKSFEHRVIILKSWNEWGEGNHLEPDLKYGHSFLNILKEETSNF